MNDKAFENAVKFKYTYLRTTTVSETEVKSRSGQVRSGQVRSGGCLLPVDWCCVVVPSRAFEHWNCTVYSW
jgi:hypothetical protein